LNFSAIIISFAFFAIHMKTWPYKIQQDNYFRATTEMHVFIVICVALVLKNDLSWEIVGVDAYDKVLFYSFLVLVPFSGIYAIFSKLQFVRHTIADQRKLESKLKRDTKAEGKANPKAFGIAGRKLCFQLQCLGLANMENRQRLRSYYIDGWSVRRSHAVFLSHFKREAATEARLLKEELIRTLRVKKSDQIFLDSDDLDDLRDLLPEVVDTDALVLMYTRGVLSRPWCLLELQTAVLHHVPIIVMQIANDNAADLAELPGIFNDFPAWLAENNKDAEVELQKNNTTAAEICQTITQPLLKAAANPVTFDPARSRATIQAQIFQLAEALCDEVCPENRDLLPDLSPAEVEPWPIKTKYAVCIVCDQHAPEVVTCGLAVKSWLMKCTPLTDDNIYFLATESQLEPTGADLTIVEESDCVLLLQTAEVLSRPRSILQSFHAARKNIPIVAVNVLSSKDEHAELMYDFEKMGKALDDLSRYLSADATRVIEACAGKSLDAVGLMLGSTLPNIISKPLGLDVSNHIWDSQLAEIEVALRGAGRRNRTAKLTADRVEQLKAAFKGIDVNGDGGVTPDEIMDAMRVDTDLCKLLGLQIQPGEGQDFAAGRLFQEMATDG
jgi:hypothetical protein